MPIRVVKGLPAIGKLSEENIFVMDSERAESQDIRPLHCGCELDATERDHGNSTASCFE